jgi:L-alanine-DL-glutamate epimerase-like enolase superfamily enzyme
MDLEVVRVDRTTVEMPYREVHARNMHRQWPSWKYFEICELELACGAVGHGETMLFYGWGKTEDEDVQRARGENAAALMWEDSLGPGLQMALFDAVGRALDVPAHDLLGGAVHEEVPLSWWCNDMPAEDWVAECEAAIEAGYENIKLKGRPWFDIREQASAVAAATPEWFRVDIDFNSTLLDAERALPILQDIEEHPQIHTFEGPLPGEAVEGYKTLCRNLDANVARHFPSDPGPETSLCEELCDGFVVCEGARETLAQADTVAVWEKPLFVQQVGTGITGAFALHLAGVSEAATLPGINCFQLYEHTLLEDPIEVSNGTAPVPDGPGLGHDVDMAKVEEYAVEKPAEEPQPPRLMKAHWPAEGVVMYFAEGQQMPDTAREADMPYYQDGATARLVPDDGSEAWSDLRERALAEPVRMDESDDPF